MNKQPNLLKPNNDQYTQHLKLTEQEFQELKQYGKDADRFFKAFFSNRNHQATKK